MLFPSRLSFAVATALSLGGAGLTWSVYKAETARQQADFDVLAQRAARRVETRIEQHIALLTASRAFIEVDGDAVEREVFASFVNSLDLEGRYSGLQGIGLARLVDPRTQAEVEAILARNYGPKARIWPESVAGLRTAITLLEPTDARNRAAIGFDMATEERRRAAMLEALETGEAAATSPLHLVQEITDDVQTGILIYLPLRRPSGGELGGFAYSPVRMGDLFTAALEGGDLPLEIRAVDADASEPALFESTGYASAVANDGLASQADLTVAGRDWILHAKPAPGFASVEPLRDTLLSALVFALLVLSTTYAVHWQAMAIRRTRALSEAVQRNSEQNEFLLREMAHRLKNALTRVSAIARQTARETDGKEEMVARLNARLQAMGAAQDLLILSGNDSADLEALLLSEIDQISGRASPAHLSGPPVHLDERQTHALALVFHELATNALKYGAGAHAGGELRITWSIQTAASNEHLELVWEERTSWSASQAAGMGSGFGTRLLEAMVLGELGGSLERQSHAEGLTLKIRFPLPNSATATGT